MNRTHLLCIIQAIEEDGLQNNCAVVGTHLLLELAKLREKFEIVGDVRGKGLMVGVEMVKDKVGAISSCMILVLYVQYHKNVSSCFFFTF